MTIRPRGKVYEVTINRASALPGYTRIRKSVTTMAEAEALEVEIETAITKYGKWPVSPTDTPLTVQAERGLYSSTATTLTKSKTRRSGTLRDAMKIALETHWYGTRYYASVQYVVPLVVDFMEERGRADIDEILSEDIDALVSHLRAKKLAPSSINKYLGSLRVVNDVALKRIPPLATIKLPIPHVSGKRIEKWWLRPDDHRKVVTSLRNPLDAELITDPMFADIIDIIVYQGLRVEEVLRMDARMFTGLDTKAPWFNPAGTKTSDAQNAIPVYPESIEPIKRSIERQRDNRWGRMFPLTPRQAGDRWNHVREFLGVSHIPTATMKSLRRTFAWYANSRGMPTATLQKVLRHKGIATTAGYLELVGAGELEQSRQYFTAPQPQQEAPRGSNVAEIIKAYAMTPGVTPEEVARFARELMT